MMRPNVLACLLSLTVISAFAQSKDESAIRQLMADQASAWNRGSLDDFMKGYWNNDSLIFIGKSGPSYGYSKALKIDRLSPDYCFVIGKWALKRKAGDIGGTYTLLFRKIDGSWVIVVDHTS